MNSYLITINPNEKSSVIVDEYRNKYSKCTCYKIPPHITIYPPFYLIDITEEEILNVMKRTFGKIESFDLRFDSVGYFEKKNNVIYFAPDKKSDELLKNILNKTLNILDGKTKDVYADYKLSKDNFTPHITIAEKIPENEFRKIKQETKNIKEKLKFTAKEIILYKQNQNSRIWEDVEKIKFKQKTP